VDEVERRLKELIKEKCERMKIGIGKMEVMPDHVHLFLRMKPIHAPNFVIGQIKGYTSSMLRKEMPFLKRKMPTLWTGSYYVESIGHISEATIEKYIADQKIK
jgi:putative transposase